MALKYILLPHGNRGNPETPKKFYAQAKGSGELTFGKLSKEIAEGSTTVSNTGLLRHNDFFFDETELITRG
jgi:hypothetical protein